MQRVKPSAGPLTMGKSRPDLVGQWHPTLNDKSPFEVGRGSHYVATWHRCPIDPRHVWTAQVKSRAIGNQGCSVCRGMQIMVGINDFKTKEPELAAQWHPTLNSKSPSEVVSGSAYVAVWTNCSIDPRHIWTSSVDSRVSKAAGCGVCLGKVVMSGINDFATLRPDLVKEWSDRNLFRPEEISVRSGISIEWDCPRGHAFERRIAERSAGQGCPFCAGNRLLSGFNDFATIHPHLLPQYDLDRNDLPPSELLPRWKARIAWKCPLEHRWSATLGSVLRSGDSGGCRGCSARTSKPEKALRMALVKSTGPTTFSPTSGQVSRTDGSGSRIQVDIIGSLAGSPRKVIVEYDGSYFHGPTHEGIDLRKTVELLGMGSIVVRVRTHARGKSAARLDLDHPRLLQLSARDSSEDTLVEASAAKILAWIAEHRTEFSSSHASQSLVEPPPKKIGVGTVRTLESKTLLGMRIAVTGRSSGALKGKTRGSIIEIIRNNGGIPVQTISRSTSILILGGGSSTKLHRATTLGIRVVSPGEFAAMIGR
jgi:hypothetical protein